MDVCTAGGMANGLQKEPGNRRRRGDSTRSVYEKIRGMILALELAPGQKIDEERLAAMCHVSRTPVREALFRLSADGLVSLLPNRVTQVAELDTATLHDYFEGMDLVQRAVNHWAALRCTEADVEVIADAASRFEKAARVRDLKEMVLANHEFHGAIADAARNKLIANAYRRLLDVGLRVARFTLYPASRNSSSDAFISAIIDEHARMIEAFRRHDVKAAEWLALSHTDRTRDRFITYLKQSGGGEIAIPERRDDRNRREPLPE